MLNRTKSRFFSSVGNHSTSKNYEVTKMFKSVFAAAAALSMSAGAAFAGPYVNVEANSGFVGSDYSGTITDLHLGYAGDAGDVGYYVQAGPSLVSPEGAETETVFSGKAGASVAATERLDLYGEVSFSTGIDDADNGYGTKIGATFSF
jgi:hypothetical protein